MGGFYTLLYVYLSEGLAFDISKHLGHAVSICMQDYGYSSKGADEFVAAHAMTEDELKRALSKIPEKLGL